MLPNYTELIFITWKAEGMNSKLQIILFLSAFLLFLFSVFAFEILLYEFTSKTTDNEIQHTAVSFLLERLTSIFFCDSYIVLSLIFLIIIWIKIEILLQNSIAFIDKCKGSFRETLKTFRPYQHAEDFWGINSNCFSALLRLAHLPQSCKS